MQDDLNPTEESLSPPLTLIVIAIPESASMVSQLQQTLRVVCPLAASACILTTLVTCVVIVKVKHIWVGGLVWPFFSDMGRGALASSAFGPLLLY